ncbi:MAG TPA: hypothetical protein VLC48_03950 [Gemmatimonadota bacterium]|nr:hypothetical protein [Gemmatimonadota bacterium]
MLRLLIPLTLIWPVLALAVEASPLRRYHGTPTREMGSLLACIIVYFTLWIGIDQVLEVATESVAVGVVAATIVSLLAVMPILWAAYKIFGVKPGSAATH